MTETNAEWSAIDFINKTITRENGFTMTLIDAMEEVIVQAERAQELEARNHSLSEESRGNFQAALDYRRENKRLREALSNIKDERD